MKHMYFMILAVLISWQVKAQINESFEGSGTPNGWTVINNDGQSEEWQFTPISMGAITPHSGSQVAKLHWESEAHDDYLITPAMDIAIGTIDRVSFFSVNYPDTDGDGYFETFDVKLSTTGNTVDDFDIVLASNEQPGYEWEAFTYDLSAYDGQTVYVAIVATATDQFYLYVDDFVADATPSCPQPINLTVDNIEASSATLGWTETGGANSWNIEYGLAGFEQGSGQVITDVTNTTYALTGLEAGTAYEFYVQAACGGNDNSAWSGPLAFTTIVTCLAPDNIQINDMLPTSVVLGWTETGTATTWNIEYGINGFTQGSGTLIENITTNPYQIDELTPDRTYQVYVQSVCSASSTSAWTGPISFSTPCSAIDPSYIANMEHHTPDLCWKEAGAGEVADGPENFGESQWTGNRAFTNANGAVVPSNIINIWDNAPREWLLTPYFNLSPQESYELKTIVAVTDYLPNGTSNAQNTDNMGVDDEVQLLITTDYGATWQNLTTWNANNQPEVTGTEYTNTLSGYSGIVQFAFFASGGEIDDFDVDFDFHIGHFEIQRALGVDNTTASALRYYPNPVNKVLHIETQQNIQQIDIYAMNGALVQSYTNNATQTQLNVSHLLSGTYIVSVLSDNKVEHFRFVKK